MWSIPKLQITIMNMQLYSHLHVYPRGRGQGYPWASRCIQRAWTTPPRIPSEAAQGLRLLGGALSRRVSRPEQHAATHAGLCQPATPRRASLPPFPPPNFGKRRSFPAGRTSPRFPQLFPHSLPGGASLRAERPSALPQRGGSRRRGRFRPVAHPVRFSGFLCPWCRSRALSAPLRWVRARLASGVTRALQRPPPLPPRPVSRAGGAARNPPLNPPPRAQLPQRPLAAAEATGEALPARGVRVCVWRGPRRRKGYDDSAV